MDVGIIGLGVMGKNLIINFLNKKIKVAIHNRTFSKAKNLQDELKNDNLKIFENLNEFLQNLKNPKKVILLVPSGPTVDSYLEKLADSLTEDDIVLDFGNSHFEDTKRRNKHKFHFMGVGISGGEEGARNGASLMVGGEVFAYKKIKDVLEIVAAKVNDEYCCGLIGPNGAGHFVKMVHNGIEYADMGLLAEAYSIFKHLKSGYKDENPNNDPKNSDSGYLYECFQALKSYDELDGYLLEILLKILNVKENNDLLLEKIDDAAMNKGTGLWTVICALKQDIALSATAAAVESRFVSNKQDDRHKFSDSTSTNSSKDLKTTMKKGVESISLDINTIAKAMILAKAVNYCQNMQLIYQQSKAEDWGVDLSQLCKIWRNGCIIRGKFLETVALMSQDNKFILSTKFNEIYNENVSDLRETVLYCIGNKISAPCLTQSLVYLDSMSSKKSNGHIVQALRDYFGSHTVKLEGENDYKHIEWDKMSSKK